MAKHATRSSTKSSESPRARRLTAEARKRSILQAARRAFTETGDMNGTTIRHIAERGGISEGVIYRHFESKDQLFFEAVVEPLTDAIDELAAASQVVDRDEPLTPERQVEALNGLYRQLISTLEEVLPLLGLVLFGDPKVARRFYRENFAAVMDRLAAAWREVEERYGFETGSPDISARAVMGIALVLALESHHTSRFDRDRAVALASKGTIEGFFPSIEPARRRSPAAT
jgi:AcrR family transcriptional regulator